MKTSIDLNLEDAQVEYEYESPYQNETPGGTEYIPGSVIINSVKSKGVELITLIPKETLEAMQDEILEEKLNH